MLVLYFPDQAMLEVIVQQVATNTLTVVAAQMVVAGITAEPHLPQKAAFKVLMVLHYGCLIILWATTKLFAYTVS